MFLRPRSLCPRGTGRALAVSLPFPSLPSLHLCILRVCVCVCACCCGRRVNSYLPVSPPPPPPPITYATPCRPSPGPIPSSLCHFSSPFERPQCSAKRSFFFLHLRPRRRRTSSLLLPVLLRGVCVRFQTHPIPSSPPFPHPRPLDSIKRGLSTLRHTHAEQRKPHNHCLTRVRPTFTFFSSFFRQPSLSCWSSFVFCLCLVLSSAPHCASFFRWLLLRFPFISHPPAPSSPSLFATPSNSNSGVWDCICVPAFIFSFSSLCRWPSRLFFLFFFFPTWFLYQRGVTGFLCRHHGQDGD